VTGRDAQEVLVVGSDTMSRYHRLHGPATCVLLATGRAPMLIEAAEEGTTARDSSIFWRSGRLGWRLSEMPAGGSRARIPRRWINGCTRTSGRRTVFKIRIAVRCRSLPRSAGAHRLKGGGCGVMIPTRRISAYIVAAGERWDRAGTRDDQYRAGMGIHCGCILPWRHAMPFRKGA